jgi:hypothetical protein
MDFIILKYQLIVVMYKKLLLVIFIVSIFVCISYCSSRIFIERYLDFDPKDPKNIKKVLDVDNYEAEKKRISYTYLETPRESWKYFMGENRHNFIEDIPFSPHIIQKSYDDIDLSSSMNIGNSVNNIDDLTKLEEERYGQQADYCFRHKHKKECILAERNYRCFGKVEFTEKECEADTDLIGNRVKPGVWDRKCVNNEDCPFYKANKNYPNDFGGCQNGYCQFPKGIGRLSYRKYNKSTLPLCYNCKDKSGKITIDKCCHLQKEPDYLFEDDLPVRLKNRKELEKKNLQTITNDIHNDEFRQLEKKLKI